MFIKDGPSTLELVSLIGWVLVEGGVSLASPCLTAICSSKGGGRCFYFIHFDLLFWLLFSIQFYLSFIYQNNNNNNKAGLH